LRCVRIAGEQRGDGSPGPEPVGLEPVATGLHRCSWKSTGFTVADRSLRYAGPGHRGGSHAAGRAGGKDHMLTAEPGPGGVAPVQDVADGAAAGARRLAPTHRIGGVAAGQVITWQLAVLAVALAPAGPPR